MMIISTRNDRLFNISEDNKHQFPLKHLHTYVYLQNALCLFILKLAYFCIFKSSDLFDSKTLSSHIKLRPNYIFFAILNSYKTLYRIQCIKHSIILIRQNCIGSFDYIDCLDEIGFLRMRINWNYAVWVLLYSDTGKICIHTTEKTLWCELLSSDILKLWVYKRRNTYI